MMMSISTKARASSFDSTCGYSTVVLIKLSSGASTLSNKALLIKFGTVFLQWRSCIYVHTCVEMVCQLFG